MLRRPYARPAEFPITWRDVDFLNGWSNYDTATHQACEYTKDALGFVHLRGLAKRGGGTSANPIFRLPKGFRPVRIQIYAQSALTAAPAFTTLRVDVEPDGDVLIPVGDGSGYISFAGITFRAEQ